MDLDLKWRPILCIYPFYIITSPEQGCGEFCIPRSTGHKKGSHFEWEVSALHGTHTHRWRLCGIYGCHFTGGDAVLGWKLVNMSHSTIALCMDNLATDIFPKIHLRSLITNFLPDQIWHRCKQTPSVSFFTQICFEKIIDPQFLCLGHDAVFFPIYK